MSRFNTMSQGTKTTNLASGEAYSQSPELELISILSTSFAGDQFYRSANQTFDRLKQVISVCDKKFVAQAAVYARTQLGMRSITHVVASELAKYISGMDWAKDFYTAIVYRPDDMMEIISYHLNVNGKVPNSMKKGFAKAFDKYDSYGIAKYRGEGKSVKMIDVVNMVHPVPIEKNAEAIRALIKGELKAFDTWEVELSKAGQLSSNEDEKADFKKEVWVKLIKEKKLKYFALLRNLRNIIQQAPEALTEALEMLTNEEQISKSLVMPFRFITAFDEIKKLTSSSQVREVMVALNKAVDLSLKNVPKFKGDTLVVLDVSGSMGSVSKIASLFAAVLMKANNSDLLIFAERAEYKNVNLLDSTTTISNALRFSGGGTNFHSIFQTANKKYDRIIILSDMQGWIGQTCPTREYSKYKNRVGANPFIYSFDLAGNGTLQFPEQNVFCLAGFNDKVFQAMTMLEEDKKVLIKKIKEVSF